MSRYDLTPAARADLLDVWHYLARQVGEAMAEHVTETLLAEMDRLAATPMIAPERPDLAPEGVRGWPVWSWMIFFLPDEPLAVLRILHCSRGITPAMFSGH